jgi:hypothetical protein
MRTWLQHLDGVHVLLADRTEVGWYPIQERYSKVNSNIPYQCEYTPEHVHHNWKTTKAYIESKNRRGELPAVQGQFAKECTNPKYF